MDNNFVNIDDLVRQRLGGGEEQERSGAWLHMRDLLDKEMPQRAGFIYWRRMFSAVAVLLLIASISVGGYELSASRNSNNTATSNVALTATPAGTTNAPVKNNEIAGTQLSSSGIADNNQPKKDNQGSKKLIAANDNQHQNKLNKKQSDNINTPKAINKAEANQEQLPIAGNNIKSKENGDVPVAKNVPATNAVSKKETSKATAPAANVPDNGKAATTNHAAVASVVKQPKEASGSAGRAKKAATPTVPNDKPANKELAGVSNKATPKTTTGVRKENKVKEEKMEALALSSHLASVSSPKVSAVNVPVTPPVTSETTGNKTQNNKVALNSAAVVAPKKKMKAVVAEKVIASKTNKVVASKDAIAKSGKTVSGKVANATPPSNSKDAKSVAANSPKPGTTQAGIIPAANADNAAMKAAYALNTKKGKKVIQKLVLYEHYIKTDPNDEHYNLDTISMETLTEELGGEDNPYIPCPKKSSAREEPNNSAKGGSGNEVASAASSSNPQILPGASASANGMSALGTKGSTASKQSSGAAALEGLSEAFNDVKYKVSGMQFAPGLTAGINGTFFGPSSFKGFQFGITGDFVFGNEWSFATELKYFQRVNNTYTLNDNAYSYTPNGGVYNMQQTTNSYSFANLHSIEMPLVLGYTNGKFKFFVGGNLVYSFSINEGQLQTETNTITTTSGNNTSLKIDPVTDFNSRFGIGCLFGLAYNVAPNVSLDLRNVMTLWDNANTQGAKYISDQLYKSPSIQLSLGYRLGKHKPKE